MTVCDICNTVARADAIRYTANQLHHAVDTGYRPEAAIRGSRQLGDMFGVRRSDRHWHREWVEQVHHSATEWLLCGRCARDLDAHLDQHASARPPRWHDLFGRRR
jgi:hypothetical protein